MPSATMIIAGAGSARRVAYPGARLPASVYRRRRVGVGGLLFAVVVLLSSMVTGALAVPGGVPASASGNGPAVEPMTIVARPGDTLWSIAEAYRGDISRDAYLDWLVRRNGGASIQAGQVIILP